MYFSDILMYGFRTAKSGLLLENIDRCELDDNDNLHIHGYVVFTGQTSRSGVGRWTIVPVSDIVMA